MWCLLGTLDGWAPRAVLDPPCPRVEEGLGIPSRLQDRSGRGDRSPINYSKLYLSGGILHAAEGCPNPNPNPNPQKTSRVPLPFKACLIRPNIRSRVTSFYHVLRMYTFYLLLHSRLISSTYWWYCPPVGAVLLKHWGRYSNETKARAASPPPSSGKRCAKLFRSQA